MSGNRARDPFENKRSGYLEDSCASQSLLRGLAAKYNRGRQLGITARFARGDAKSTQAQVAQFKATVRSDELQLTPRGVAAPKRFPRQHRDR